MFICYSFPFVLFVRFSFLLFVYEINGWDVGELQEYDGELLCWLRVGFEIHTDRKRNVWERKA